MRLTLLSAALLLGSFAASFAQAPGYHVTKTVPLGAPDRWDYLVYDGPSHRLYVAHGDRLSVLDGKNGSVLGTVQGMPGGSHGIGIVAAAGKGYTDDGEAGQAVAFDLTTLRPESISRRRTMRTASPSIPQAATFSWSMAIPRC